MEAEKLREAGNLILAEASADDRLTFPQESAIDLGRALLTAADTIAAQSAEIEALNADAERLDWLEAEWEKNGDVHFSSTRPRQPEVCNLFTCTTQHIKARGFRNAIDAARQAAGGST